MPRERISKVPIKITEVPISSLKPADYNPRKWNDDMKERLKESIRKFGAVDPLIVNGAPKRNGVVIGGHFRLQCMKELGFAKVPVVFVNIPSIDRERELNVRLNRNQGEWDFDKLKNFDVSALLDRHVGLLTPELMAGEHGFEPWNGGFKGPCLTAWLLPNKDERTTRAWLLPAEAPQSVGGTPQKTVPILQSFPFFRSCRIRRLD